MVCSAGSSMLPDRDDAAVADPDVGDDAGCAGAVDDRAAPDDRVEHLRPQCTGKGLTTRQIVTSAFSTVFRPGASMSERGEHERRGPTTSGSC